jgi:hypothetical protein
MACQAFREIDDDVQAAEVIVCAAGSPALSADKRSPFKLRFDPALQRRYCLYKRAKAAVALPPGSERVAALQAAKIDRKN